MKKRSCVIVASAILSGCLQSSGALQLGPDTYSLSVHAAPVRGEAGARKAALTEAAEFCQQKGKELMVNNITSGSRGSLPGDNIVLTFRCLRQGDSDLQRPDYSSTPDVVIEQR
ncbi:MULTISPECIES: hypothetical protein [Enterobacterales]|uniref:hypothetical protein n=1 Tax=Enterobacterales TaxID=91347 RepID=UPI002ED95ED5